ncbi:MAG: CBS domain-containing protein [Gammaproteobacteria bacterium]|uniref:CBS domain protein n=1 Tax=Marinobacter nitratireducens TaxID=1137280 RepID=A0A072MX21_9GAMM|nr:CBS domain-containing protein [Marinobacter nitratireducens]KEF29964.1 CBS domain protein [Marinobacter nitratireducens]TNE78113.1 MAG: CBS domain-containing protein [Gammaproteobacteria bacterium]TNE98845.1 MAG: CBS domain-containing protein [Gammaproteobacteria bacterium]
MRSLKVSDVMWNHIEPIRCGTPLTRVVKTLLHNHVTGLPVVDDHRHVLGFVSEQDCIHSLLVSSYHCEGDPIVDDVMFREPVTISPEMAVVDLAQNLGAGKPKVYPVVDHGKLIGIVTRTAILSELARTGCGIEAPKYAGSAI